MVKPGADPDSLIVEVWGRSRVLKQLKVPKKLHGPVYADGWFGSGASWSQDESLLAYVAEVCAAPTLCNSVLVKAGGPPAWPGPSSCRGGSLSALARRSAFGSTPALRPQQSKPGPDLHHDVHLESSRLLMAKLPPHLARCTSEYEQTTYLAHRTPCM